MTDDFFGDPIDIYSRSQAILDGEQFLIEDVELVKIVKDIGYIYPLYLTKSIWAIVVSSVNSSHGVRSGAGILHDILFMSRYSIIGRRVDGVSFTVKIEGVDRNLFIPFTSNRRRGEDIFEFAIICGATDYNNPTPCLTLMLPDEV